MNPAPEGTDALLAQAVRKLAQLHREIDEARATLGNLRAARATATAASAAAELRDANEQLVLTALAARDEAEAALRARDDMSHAAEFDALTGLPNRTLLLDRLTLAIASAKRYGRRLALLFLDLNNFKQINDMLGHQAGDQVLKLVADRLSAAIRNSDTVCRYGGDEFLILLPELSRGADAVPVAEGLIAALDTPSQMGDQVLRLSASIGISLYPEDGEDVETLIRLADAAMYRAKRDGPGSFIFRNESFPVVQAPAPQLRPPALRRPLTLRNLTDSDQRNALLRDANEQLIVAALSAQELQAAVERAHHEQQKILSLVAHELRNPLGPIRNAASLLSRIQKDELPRMQAIIERQVDHMTRLVGDLLDLSRVSTGKLSIDRRLIDLTDMVDEAIDACRPAMDARVQHLDVLGFSRGLKIYADPVRLVQVLSNLLDNASKYTPEGGTISLSLKPIDNDFIIAVSDTGIGISAEALPDIFNPFMQAPHAMLFNGAGLGIGLTVVRELVEAHGGNIIAASAGLGQGSCFIVTLPRPEK